jgi:hypothetical protein
MLPILRILPVGGVLLAIMLLMLALNPPDGSYTRLGPSVAPTRGALIARGEHPEWRQFLMLAAIRRADELNRLRELPDPPARTEAAPAAPTVAGLSTGRNDNDPEADDQTGSIMQPPPATIPIDIGESSAFELPVAPPNEQPPVIKPPPQAKPGKESGDKIAPRTRRAKAPAGSKAPAQFDPFKAMFGEQKLKQPPTVGANTR